MPTYDGTEGAAIELSQAAKWTKIYRDSLAEEATAGGRIKAHFFGRDILLKILKQDGCMGIRMYYAKDENGQKQLILVGANAEGEDMVEGTIADKSHFCPPDCVESELNG
ncbi:hypothetical protein POKO110462_03670 [Pontibacter korlensis]|uniref:Uncharacterized protein n=1 Tax=Pontibacter korlensis TaxID=400092 RepID=A0A0E3ZHR2_9BACT|nr:hypothetical protein [Pontibacter korlensis]AKD05688.1 hypothetical protein PKOR_12635 [Pontibacter korlensis]